jgi:heme-degrading monooxygenase HmoA
VDRTEHREPTGETGPASTPEPPYWAVIFTSRRCADPAATADYGKTADRMLKLAAQQPGYLGVETVEEGGVSITVSYWADEAAIGAWRRDADHAFAQYEGRTRWYDAYELRVAKVERARSFVREGS